MESLGAIILGELSCCGLTRRVCLSKKNPYVPEQLIPNDFPLSVEWRCATAGVHAGSAVLHVRVLEPEYVWVGRLSWQGGVQGPGGLVCDAARKQPNMSHTQVCCASATAHVCANASVILNLGDQSMRHTPCTLVAPSLRDSFILAQYML